MKNEPVEDPKKLSDFYDKDHKYKNAKKNFRIACDWCVFGTMDIEATTLEEALEIAETYDLPMDTEYLDDSFQINEEMTDEFYKQDYET